VAVGAEEVNPAHAYTDTDKKRNRCPTVRSNGETFTFIAIFRITKSPRGVHKLSATMT
jgi:hypothetical protein